MCTNKPCKYCVKIISLLPELKYTDKILLNLGKHYQYIESNYYYKLMKKYYLIAIDKDNSSAMNNLGLYYKNIENNYDLMKKYYLMAIEMGNSNAMTNLGLYYKNIENNYDLMKKYYLMAIEKGNRSLIINLGVYYSDIENNYNLMKKYYLLYNKYYLMAINKYKNIIPIIYYNYKKCNYKLL